MVNKTIKKADIKTGFLCNNDCLFCVQGSEKKKFGNKKTEEIKKILDEAKKDCQTVVFTGGEPTIRQDIIKLVEYAKESGFSKIQIQSNGRMFAYEDFCKKMIRAGANEFALALHGHIPELHDYLTQSESFLQTVRGIKNLKKLKQTVIMNTVITRSNYRHLPEIAKLFVSLDVDQFQFAFVHAIGSAGKNFQSIVPRMTMVVPYLKKAINIGKHFNKQAMVEAVPFCFLKGYEENISENLMPEMKIYDQDFIIKSYTQARITKGKAKGPQCKKCKYFNVCEGSWKEYPDNFGWDEFETILK